MPGRKNKDITKEGIPPFREGEGNARPYRHTLAARVHRCEKHTTAKPHSSLLLLLVFHVFPSPRKEEEEGRYTEKIISDAQTQGRHLAAAYSGSTPRSRALDLCSGRRTINLAEMAKGEDAAGAAVTAVGMPHRRTGSAQTHADPSWPGVTNAASADSSA